MSKISHPAQRRTLARTNQLLGIIEDHQGIFTSDLLAVCFVNFGWSKRSTRSYLDLLIQFGKLREDDNRIFTYTYNAPSKQMELNQ